MSQKAAPSLIKSEERFRLLVDAVQDYAIYLLDVDGQVVTWNAGAQRNKGYLDSEIIGQSFAKFFRPEDVAAGLPAQILATVAAAGRFAGEGWRVRKDGSCFWASVVVNPLRGEHGEIIGYAKVTRDLTERKHHEDLLRASELALQAEKDRLYITLFSIADGVISTDQQGVITIMNPTAEAMTGWTLDEARKRTLEEVFHLVDAESAIEITNPIRECLAQNQPVYLQEGVALITRSGERRDIQDSVAPIRAADGEIIGTVVVFQDVTRIRKIQRDLAFSATHDPLTLLPNRKLFLDSLTLALQGAETNATEHILCFLDLDRFKIINDTAGHAAGDVLLRTVAEVLTRHTRESDIVARLGGDEFALILHGCTAENAHSTLATIIEAIESMNFRWEDRLFHISASMGVTAIKPGSDAPEIMKQADVACYAAKHAGRNRISVYKADEGEGHERHQQLTIAADVRDAVAQDRFSLFTQKIVALRSIQVPHYEILLRMRDSKGSALLPGQFIPAAERYGQMGDIDQWVFNRVLCRHDAALHSFPDIRLNINLSANSLNDPKFLPFFLSAMERSALSPSAITLEITETSLINNLVVASTTIEKVRSIGCKVALDDFGIGLCSFAYLRTFKVDYVKVEGSFVRNIDHSAVDLCIVRAINNIAHEMHSQTVAEFVENDAVLARVRELDIDFAQGYLFGRPEPIESLLALQKG
ncbi:MAG: EAL domain-containing protein [Candidatus Sulfotelmatobacter sp.]